MGISWLIIAWLVIGFIVMYVYYFRIRYPKATINSMANDLAMNASVIPTPIVIKVYIVWMVVLLVASVVLFPLLIVGYFKWKKRQNAETKYVLG